MTCRRLRFICLKRKLLRNHRRIMSPFNKKYTFNKPLRRSATSLINFTQFSQFPTIAVRQGGAVVKTSQISNAFFCPIPNQLITLGTFLESVKGANLINEQFCSATSARISKWYRLLTKSVNTLSFLKLKYKGKSFRWHRKKASLVLRFGRSHLVIVKPKPHVKWRKLSRMKIIFFGCNLWYIKKFLQKAVSWRPLNIYHGRGLRLSRQKVHRKSGKVSAYR